LGLIQHKISDQKSTIMAHTGILGLWPIMAIKPIEHRGSKLGSMNFFNISIKFLIDRVPFCQIGEQATGADDHEFQNENDTYA
jgi:hypothetical protein